MYRYMKTTNVFPVVFTLLLLINIIGTGGYMLIEKWPVVDALYMTVITIATVGFGEIRPLSPGGRLFTIFLIISGMTVITYSIQLVALHVIESNLIGNLWRRKMEKQIAGLRDHTIVCGYGKIGRHVAEYLQSMDSPYVVIDNNQAFEDAFRDEGVLFIDGDAAEETVLHKAGIDRAKALVAVVGTDPENMFITMTARGLNPNLLIVARAEDINNKGKLIRAGADKVVLPYEIGGRRIGAHVLQPSVVKFFDTVMSTDNLELTMAEVEIVPQSCMVGRDFRTANIRSNTGCIVLAIKQENDLQMNPAPDTVMQPGDVLICIGTGEQVTKLQSIAGGN